MPAHRVITSRSTASVDPDTHLHTHSEHFQDVDFPTMAGFLWRVPFIIRPKSQMAASLETD